MTPGIYEFGPRQNAMAYGGRSGNIERRWGQHRRMLRNDKHHCAHLQNAWNKYGEDVFEFRVLGVIEDPGERLAAEQAWLDKRHAEGTCYNAARDATASMSGRKHTEDFCQAQSERMMGKQHALGSKRTEEQRRKQGERMMGKYHTEEAKRKNRDAHFGELNHMWGKHHSEKTKQKLREASMGNQNAKGYRHTDATKRKVRDAHIGHPISDVTKRKIGIANAKPYPAFIHKDAGEIIPAGRNLSQLCRERGLSQVNMYRVQRRQQSQHRGWVLFDSALAVTDDGG